MKILFNIGHPAHVHLFKNLIRELERKGHQCKITAIAKDISLHLLNAYGFEYEVVGRGMPTLASKAIELIRIELRLYCIARSFEPDILVGGVGNVYVAHVGKLISRPSIIFDDTEHAKIEHFIMDPFATAICTPSCYCDDLGKKQIRYNGYHELAYLHPNRFTPNPAVLDEIGLSKEDPFIILRFVSWTASHDVGQNGIKGKIELVQKLERYGRVLITSEGELERDLEKYKVSISPEEIHDLMYYASLYIGEGATMATEAALLGTPSIYISSLVGTMGNFNELEGNYGLLYCYNDTTDALLKAFELIREPDVKVEWQRKRKKLLEEKIDVTGFMVWLVENYPESCQEVRENPRCQDKFK